MNEAATTEKLSSSALVVHKTLNLIISLRFLSENDKEMHQDDKRTCSAYKSTVFLIKYEILWGCFVLVVIGRFSDGDGNGNENASKQSV